MERDVVSFEFSLLGSGISLDCLFLAVIDGVVIVVVVGIGEDVEVAMLLVIVDIVFRLVVTIGVGAESDMLAL